MKRVIHFSKKTFSSLSVRNYRLYFFGQAISLCGTWMQIVGLAWLVLKITNSGTQLGLVTAAQFLPSLLFAPIAGVIVDRYSKRNLLLFTQSASMLLSLLFGILVVTNLINLLLVYVLAFLLGIVIALDNPVRQTFVVEMVGEDKLKNAISLNSVQFNVARLIGPAIAGAFIAYLGIAVCFFFNSASFVGVIVALLFMNVKELLPAKQVKSLKGQMTAGLKYVAASKVLSATLIMLVIIGTLAYEFQVSLPLIAKFTFAGDASVYAMLTSAMGLGAIVGGLFAASRKEISNSMLVFFAFALGVSLLFTSLAPNLDVAVLGMILVGIFSINFTTMANVSLQTQTLPEMRGRVMALWTMAFLGSTPIGGPIVGFVGEYFGARFSLGVGAFATLLAAVVGWLIFSKISTEVANKDSSKAFT